MKKYNVTVNGTLYEVEVEEVGEVATASVAAPVAATSTPAAAPAPVVAPKAAPKPVAKPAASGSTGSVKVEAPMPGTVTKVFVTPGQAVKAGENLIAFEAMKMEQEVKAPQDGTVASVNVSAGQNIGSGDLLVSMN